MHHPTEKRSSRHGNRSSDSFDLQKCRAAENSRPAFQGRPHQQPHQTVNLPATIDLDDRTGQLAPAFLESFDPVEIPTHAALRFGPKSIMALPRTQPPLSILRPSSFVLRPSAFPMKLVVTGSIAFDYLMSFPGKFIEHFLPGHIDRVSLSFLVDTMDKRRGGCAPNIAYTLALLGERPYLMATAGQDFPDYRQWLEAAGVDTSLVKQGREVQRVVFLQHRCRQQPDRLVLRRRHGQLRRALVPDVKDCGLVIISPNDPAAMIQYAEECRSLGIPFIFDPGQQCTRMSGGELKNGIVGARVFIANDYEMELIRQKTGMNENEVLGVAETLIVTRGENGSSIYRKDGADQRASRQALPHRRSYRRRRRISRRPDEGACWRSKHQGRGSTRQRSGNLRARAPRRSKPLLHLERIHARYQQNFGQLEMNAE